MRVQAFNPIGLEWAVVRHGAQQFWAVWLRLHKVSLAEQGHGNIFPIPRRRDHPGCAVRQLSHPHSHQYCSLLYGFDSPQPKPILKYILYHLVFREHVSSPTIVNIPGRPIRIFANFDRSAVITDDGKAYIFGGKDMSDLGG